MTDTKPYYMNQTGWTSDEYYGLHRYLHRLILHYDRKKDEIQSMDIGRMSDETKVLLFCIIEYVRFVLDTYDSDFYKKHEPGGLEIHYLGQSFEGEKLDIEKLSLEDGDLFRIRRDGEEITACKFSWQKSRNKSGRENRRYIDQSF